MTKEDILKQCTVSGNVVKLPLGQLDKKLFSDVKKALGLIGGTWTGGKVFGFVFESDPTELLNEIATGTKRNIKKEFQFYATSPKLADEVVALAAIEAGETVLEPSAGRGALVDAVDKLGLSIDIHCCELMEENRKFLFVEKGCNLVGADFTKFVPKIKYDKVIANPPFTKNQDIKHIRLMYNMINDCGKVVSIASMGWMQASNKEAKQFRQWLDDAGYYTDDREAPLAKQWHTFGNVGIDTEFTRKNGDTVYIKMLDAKEFQGSGVNVKTCIILINRYTGH